jgi:ribosome assembly protein SQT1
LDLCCICLTGRSGRTLLAQVFSGHSGAVRCGRFAPDGKTVVTGGGENDATLRVWDPKTGACSGTIQGAHFHTVGALLSVASSVLESGGVTPTALDTSVCP